MIYAFQKCMKKGKTCQEIIGILCLTMFSARKLCTYKRKDFKKHEQRFILDKAKSLIIKSKMELLRYSHQKVVSFRIVNNLNLKVSVSTVKRHLMSCGYKYKRPKLQIILSDHHKHENTKIVDDWIAENHDWSKIISSDEKRFTLEHITKKIEYITRKKVKVLCVGSCE